MSKLSKFGEIVRVKRVIHGLSLSDTAQALGCSPSLLSAIEIGQKPPTVDLVLTAAGYFEMTTKERLDLVKAAIKANEGFRLAIDDDLVRELFALMAVFSDQSKEKHRQRAVATLRRVIESFDETSDNNEESLYEERRLAVA